jgi:hypothetical protein
MQHSMPDRYEIGISPLVSRPRAPAMGLEEISRRGQGVRCNVETPADAIVEDVLGQKLCMTDLTMHGAARAC